MGTGGLAAYKSVAAGLGAWICFLDESGCALRPNAARTWARRGCTPVVRVTGSGSGRVHLAGLIAIRPGQRTRLIWRAVPNDHHRGPGSFDTAALTGLLAAAHRQLGGRIVLIWDNATGHVKKDMRRWISAQPWLTMFRLPAYAPQLNPVELVWSHLKRGLANLAPHTTDELTALITDRLHRLQRRRDGILDHFIIHTGLELTGYNPQPP